MAAKRNSPRKERDIRRKVGVRPVKKSFLIVCEGQNTEPDYFNSFRLTSATVKAVGKGLGTRTLVKEAVGIRQEEQRKGKTYDQYWFILHFHLYQGPLHRSKYAEMLTKLTGMPYSKKAGVASALYNLLFLKMDTAISHAKTVLASFNEGTTPAKAESATTVFALAEQLRVYM